MKQEQRKEIDKFHRRAWDMPRTAHGKAWNLMRDLEKSLLQDKLNRLTEAQLAAVAMVVAEIL